MIRNPKDGVHTSTGIVWFARYNDKIYVDAVVLSKTEKQRLYDCFEQKRIKYIIE